MNEPIRVMTGPEEDGAELDVSLRILYEDADLLAVEKPAGIPVHPAGKYVERSLVRALRSAMAEDPGAPAHRLDRDTSGVVLFLRTPLARRMVGKAIQARRIGKLYLALTEGIPGGDAWPARRGSRTIDLALGADPADEIVVRRVVRSVEAGGLAARTRYRVLGARGRLALVAAVPLTGRTHQIRVHMAAVGAPLAGDKLYGRDPDLYLALRTREPTAEESQVLCGLRRHALHAAVLRVEHPRTARIVRIVSPLPDDLRSAWTAAR